MTGRSWLALAGLTVVASVLGLVVNDFYRHVLITGLLYAGLAAAWNIVGGMAGQFSLGHTAFFGLGAYTSTLLFIFGGVSPWVGILAGGVLAAILSAVIGWPAARLRGVFFSMVTLSFGEVIRMLAIYLRRLTSLPYGVSVPFKPGLENLQFYGKLPFVFVAVGYVVMVLAIGAGLASSRFGYRLAALRENEDAAQALGVYVARTKVAAMALSAFLTAVGGSLMIQYIAYIDPDSAFSMAFSVQLPLIVIIGGVGTVWGPVLGAFVVTPLNEFLRAWLSGVAQGLHMFIYGVVLVVVVLVLPNGLISLFGRKPARGRRLTPGKGGHANAP